MEIPVVEVSADAGHAPLAPAEIQSVRSARRLSLLGAALSENEDEIAGMKPTFVAMQQRKDQRMREGRFRVKRSNIGQVTDATNLLVVSCVAVRLAHALVPQVDWLLAILQDKRVPVLLTIIWIAAFLWGVYNTPEHVHSSVFHLEMKLCVLWVVWVYNPEGKNQPVEEFWTLFWEEEKPYLIFFATVIGLTVLSFVCFQYVAPCLNILVFWRGNATSWWFCVKRESSCTRELNLTGRIHRNLSRLRRSEALANPPPRHMRQESQDSWHTFSYLPHGWLSYCFCCSRNRFRYQGRLNSNGRPDGLGAWHDNAFHGEYLQGKWEDGKPSRGFMSRAFGTSAQTSQRPIGYATSREDWKKGSWICPKRGIARYGVSQVEVSRAGGFFSFLPFVGEHEPCTTVADMKQTLADGVCPEDEGAANEALVFIHGFNCSLEEALGRLGQLLVLGGLSKDVDPFLFSYSGGSGLTYFEVKAQMSSYANDFAAFLNGLGDTYDKVHILAHSCGAHFLFMNWPIMRQEPCSWNLGTLTLLNPDVVMEIARPLLPQMIDTADLVTIYVDENDQALWFSWLTQTMGRLTGSTLTWFTKQSLTEPVVLLGATLELAGGSHASSPFSVAAGDGCSITPVGSGFHSTESELEGAAGNVDIINCSDIEQNVHNLRHCYYMLNTQMVADICEIIGEGRRASERRRLISIPEGNSTIYTFACPPGGYHPD